MSRKKYSKIEDFIDSSSNGSIFNKNKFFIIYLLIFIIFGILIYRLFVMQIVQGSDYLSAANQNYKSRNTVRAPRGLIYDKDGEKLAYNVKQYSVYVDPLEFDEDNIDILAKIINIDLLELKDKIENDQVYGRATVKSDISLDEYLTISSQIKDIEGVYTEAGVGREYSDNYLYSHIIGYLGDASEEDLNDKVDAQSRVGKTGIERLFDDEIRGDDGVQISEIDINTGNEKFYIPSSPVPGNNVILSIDNDWQKLAYQVLKDKVVATDGLGGAFTVMEVDTGKVRVMASYPTVNLEEFSDGISYDSFEELLNDPGTPLLERNINVALPTGSVFKVLTGGMALEEGVVTPEDTFYSDGCMTLPGEQEFCESFFRKLGDVDIYRAIKLSSNIYFCNVSLELEKEYGGIDTFLRYTNSFGIGRRTDIDLPNETAGEMATPDLKFKLLGEPWYSGDTCNVSIGQGLLSATPLQMAVATAAIENDGEVVRPLLIERFQDVNGHEVKSFEKEVVDDVPISEENFEIIRDAMEKAIRDSDGTVRKLNFYDDYIIGKTGTATSPVRINGVLYNEPHAWVMGVFEKDEKRYAFVVNIAHGGWGEETVEVVSRFLQGI